MKKGKSYACKDKKEHQLRPGDHYPTPKSLVWSAKDLFLKVIPTWEEITEPCCGNGLITTALKDIGYKRIIENDLINKRTDILHKDCMDYDLSWSSNNVITNFPFSAWDECVINFLQKPELENLITIGRLNYLSTNSRFQKGLWEHLKEVWIFNRYIDYRTPERADGNFNVGAMATGWFWFTKEKVDAPVIRFVDVQQYATLGNLEE